MPHSIMHGDAKASPTARMGGNVDPKGRGSIQISAELPLIYATGRRTRASKLETEPFLRSLPVYRYRAEP